MTLEEAANLAILIGYAADHGSEYAIIDANSHMRDMCVRELCAHATRLFPQFKFARVEGMAVDDLPGGEFCRRQNVTVSPA